MHHKIGCTAYGSIIWNVYRVKFKIRVLIRVLGWVLPDNHDIYGQYNSSCENVFLSNLVYSLNSYHVCKGIPDNLSIDYSFYESIFYWSNECSILTKTSVCIGCSQKQKKLLQRNNKSIKRKANSSTIPLKPQAPISLTSPEIIKVTIQSYRIENKILKSEIQNFNTKYQNHLWKLMMD